MSDRTQRPAEELLTIAESDDLLAELDKPRDPIAQLIALKDLCKRKASLEEVDLWSLSSRANVAVKAVLANLEEITDRGKAPLVRKLVVMTGREIPRATVVEMIVEFLTALGAPAKGAPNNT